MSDERFDEDLKSFGASLAGSFPERYRALLNQAFQKHALILNARQLRDYANGGAQSTAQTAIDAWLKEIRSKMSYRLNVGGNIPAAFTEHIEKLVPELWAFTKSLASQEFDVERAGLSAKLERAVQESELRGQELSNTLDTLARTSQQLTEVTASLDSLNSQHQKLQQDFARLEQSSAAQQKRIEALQSQMELAAQEHAAQIARITKESSDRRADEMARHSRELANLQKQTESTIQALMTEKRELAAARDKAARDMADSEIGKARLERDFAQTRAQLDKAAADLEQSKLSQHQQSEQFQMALAALQEQLTTSKALANDLGPITQWVLNGMPTTIPNMSPACVALAQVLAKAWSQQKKPVKGSSAK